MLGHAFLGVLLVAAELVQRRLIVHRLNNLLLELSLNRVLAGRQLVTNIALGQSLTTGIARTNKAPRLSASI